MLPLKDNVPTRAFPAVTVGLIAANVVVWLWEWQTGVEKEVLHYGYYPCSVEGPCVAPASTVHYLPWFAGVFTSMFMHASWIHIGGNMLFLWIFGNNVEEAMGRLRYLAFYLLAGVVAVYSQAAIDPSGTLPSIGASGAIAGVLGAYAVLLPRARVLTVVFLIFFFTLIEIPAYVMLGLWFVLQFIPAVGQVAVPDVAGNGGVAYFAHVGGFMFGLALVKLFARHPPGRPAPLATG